MSKEQVKRLLEAAQGNKLEALYVLAVHTGMRSGELLGLRWKDVDLEGGIVQVRRSVFNGQIEAPKSVKGNRSIKLTRTSIRALREHERTSEWVFCTNVGTTISVHNLHNRSWKPLLVRANTFPQHEVPQSPSHLCNPAFNQGKFIPRSYRRCSGTLPSTITLDTYSHVLPNMQEKAVEAMEDFFDGKD